VSGRVRRALHDLKLALTRPVRTRSSTPTARTASAASTSSTSCSPTGSTVEVGDAGSGFDPNGGRANGEDELEEGGLGIAIIRALTDEVEIGEREAAAPASVRQAAERLSSGERIAILGDR
jgi:hypothetical protein